MTQASQPELRPLDIDTPQFSTRFDENGLTVTATPYRGAELIGSWVMFFIAGALMTLFMLDTAVPPLRLLAKFRTPVAHPPHAAMGAIMVAVPALVCVWFASRLVYRLLGNETVHMDTTTVTLTKSLFGVTRTRRFEMERVRSVRTWGWSRSYYKYATGHVTHEPPTNVIGDSGARQVIPTEPGGLLFVYDGVPVRFLTALRPRPAVEVLKVIVRVWPRLLAMSEGTRVGIHEGVENSPVSQLNDTSPW